MEIKATEIFRKCVKPLAKRYRSLRKDYDDLLDELEKNPQLGIDLGDGYRKVRMAIASKILGYITRVLTHRDGAYYLTEPSLWVLDS